MTIIYQAEKPHRCSKPDQEQPLDSIWRCGECGRFWLRRDTYSDYWVNRWVPVRWYHRAAHKRITQWQEKRALAAARQRGTVIPAPNAAQTLTNKTVQESIYAKLRDTVPGEGYVPLDRQHPRPYRRLSECCQSCGKGMDWCGCRYYCKRCEPTWKK